MKRITFLVINLLLLGGSAHAQLTPSAPVQVSVGIGGAAPDGISSNPAVPPNGEVMVFSSSASNLVAGDSNDATDIFLADKNNVLSRVNLNSSGEQANGPSEEPAISPLFPDGAFAVAYATSATNLSPELGPVLSNKKQVYLHIPAINRTVLISRALTGSAIGGDGDSVHASVTSVEEKAGRRYIVAYSSKATNVSNETPPMGPGTNGPPARIIFAIVDAATGDILSTRALGVPGGVLPDADFHSPILNGKGDTIAFVTAATNIGYSNPSFQPQVLISRKESGGAFQVISVGADGVAGTGVSESPSMSFNGDFIAYQTGAYNILDSSASQRSAALFNSRTGATTRINESAQGVRNSAGISFGVKINRNGRLATFIDTSDVFVAGDTNQKEDVFVKDISRGDVIRVSTSAAGLQSDADVRHAVIGGAGYNKPTAFVAFDSNSSTLATVGNGTPGNVYKVTLTFPPPPFRKETKLENPPDVTASKRRLEIVLQEFDKTASTSAEKPPKAGTVEYDVRVTKLAAKKGIRRSTKTNRVVLRNLPAGKYNVRYRVHGNVDGKKVTTGFSPTLTVLVPKS